MKYDKEYLRRLGKSLEGFLEVEDSFFKIEGISREDYEAARKKVKELIKILKKGKDKHLDEVIRKDVYYDMKNRGDLD